MCVYIYTHISEHKQNEHKDGNRAQPLKWLLKTLSVPRLKEVHWLHHRCYMGEHKSIYTRIYTYIYIYIYLHIFIHIFIHNIFASLQALHHVDIYELHELHVLLHIHD